MDTILVRGGRRLQGEVSVAGAKNAALPILFGRNGNLGIVITVILVIVSWILIYRTPLGFEIRTVGANPDAARSRPTDDVESYLQ